MVKNLSILFALFAVFGHAPAAQCPVRWDPQPAASAYRIWRGIELLATVSEPRAVLDLPTDQISTLTVTACNAQSESEHSDPLPVRPVTPQSTTNLIEWVPQKPFFVRATPTAFFRFSYPSSP